MKALVALDTNHVKQYVFPTSKLKEIRGASSLLDRLNREDMQELARLFDGQQVCVYKNGGSGLFVLDAEKAEAFCNEVEAEYRKQTKQGASITYAIQPLPAWMPDDEDGILDAEIPEELALIRYRLQAQALCPPDISLLPSHPFMRTCDSCGLRYAEAPDLTSGRDADELERRYCMSCLAKRQEDRNIKEFIDKRIKDLIKGHLEPQHTADSAGKSPLWDEILKRLAEKDYPIPRGTERPHDFQDFRQFAGARGYLGLIYADGNGMGAQREAFTRLRQLKDFAETVDNAVYDAVCDAIVKWLPVYEAAGREPLFPFDLLLLGGDDVLMVTSAEKALDVAHTIAQRFYDHANKGRSADEKKYTLSVGVVLAPVSYPFGMLRDLAEDTLKHAKKEGAKHLARTAPEYRSDYGETSLNFLTVMGSTSQDFQKVYASLREQHGRVSGHERDVEFYATLRPYTLESLTELLKLIREGKKLALGRTKLHQMREAILQMNLTSSVTAGLSVLRNWKHSQQEFVLQHIYTLGGRFQERHRDDARPATLFPRVTFPWVADGPDTYRTSLLDFVELYDFVAQEGAGDAHQD